MTVVNRLHALEKTEKEEKKTSINLVKMLSFVPPQNIYKNIKCVFLYKIATRDKSFFFPTFLNANRNS